MALRARQARDGDSGRKDQQTLPWPWHSTEGRRGIGTNKPEGGGALHWMKGLKDTLEGQPVGEVPNERPANRQRPRAVVEEPDEHLHRLRAS